MKKRLTRFAVVCSLCMLIFTLTVPAQAQASWGAARLAEILKRQQPAPTVPSQPPAPQPQPEPIPEPQPQPDPDPAPQPTGLSAQEMLLFNMVNAERVKNGLKPLVLMNELTGLARLKSQDIIKYNYFAHTSPTYGSFGKMVYDAGIRYYSVGENLAKCRDARQAFYLFLGSSGHKANMLSKNFTHIGIGIVPDKYGVVVTQLFIMK